MSDMNFDPFLTVMRLGDSSTCNSDHVGRHHHHIYRQQHRLEYRHHDQQELNIF